MAKKKLFTKAELQKLSAEEIINKIQNENYSLLASLGAENLRKEMVAVGKVCNAVVNYLFRSTGPKKDSAKHDQAARKKLIKVLSKVAPGSYEGMPKNVKNGLVIGFNHPSLGEIGRLMTMKADLMGDKITCFPTNIAWYEALAPNYERIKRLGFIITPTISPSTWKKLNLKEGTPLYESASRIKRDFRQLYTDTSHDVLKKGGIIFVAPSATRQATVFKNKDVYDKKEDIIPTMSMLAVKLYQDKDMNCSFLPIAIKPPKNYGRALNIGKRYELIPCKAMTADYIRKTYFKSKNPKRLEGFDYDFHQRIADKLPKEFWY